VFHELIDLVSVKRLLGLFFFFWQYEVVTQGLALARQAIYHASLFFFRPQSIFALVIFWIVSHVFAWDWPQTVILLPMLPT
jgi:hypothetical protein